MKNQFRLNHIAMLLLAGLVIFSSCDNRQKEKNENEVAVNDTTPDGIKLAGLSEKLQQNPNDPQLLHERARLFISMKKFPEAVADMNKLLSIDSTKSVYYLTLADLSFAANRTFDAKTNLEHALALDPENTEAMMRLAELNLIVRKYADSVKLLTKVLDKDKSNTTAWLMRGINFKENGDTAQAISDFRSAIEVDPNFYNAYMQLGILYQLKNNPIAEGYFTNAIRINPKSEEALYGRGLWFQDHDKLDKAIQDYTTIVQLNPNNKNAHFNLGYIHQIYLKIYPEAVKHYTQAILADPSYAEAFFNRGLCYEAVGNFRDAASDFKSALALRKPYAAAEEAMKRVEGK